MLGEVFSESKRRQIFPLTWTSTTENGGWKKEERYEEAMVTVGAQVVESIVLRQTTDSHHDTVSALVHHTKTDADNEHPGRRRSDLAPATDVNLSLHPSTFTNFDKAKGSHEYGFSIFMVSRW